MTVDLWMLGVSAVDVSELPVGRVRELARYGRAAELNVSP